MGISHEMGTSENAEQVALPHSVVRLVRAWAEELGVEPADVLRSLISCGIGYLMLSYPESHGLSRMGTRAIEDLARLAPKDAPVTWHHANLEQGRVVREEARL